MFQIIWEAILKARMEIPTNSVFHLLQHLYPQPKKTTP